MSYPSDKKEEDLKVQKSSLLNSPPVAIFSYCMSSILMTVTNKYVLSVGNFNFNCILLAVQVCLFYYFYYYYYYQTVLKFQTLIYSSIFFSFNFRYVELTINVTSIFFFNLTVSCMFTCHSRPQGFKCGQLP